MNTTLGYNWNGFSASVPGAGHIRYGVPCQDASATIVTPRPALIVCDGRGSASKSHIGAQAAVKAFITQCAIFEPQFSMVLDQAMTEKAEEGWHTLSQLMYRTLMQVKLDLSNKYSLPDKEFDCTVAFAIVGKSHIGCFQVGDGAIVLRQNGQALTAFLPDKGEFANQTHFLRQDGERKGGFQAKLFDAIVNSGIAITSDGPEHLMFDLKQMQPARIFAQMFDDLQSGELLQQDLMDFLTRADWNKDPRGNDDRSIAILAPATAECATKSTQSPVVEENVDVEEPVVSHPEGKKTPVCEHAGETSSASTPATKQAKPAQPTYEDDEDFPVIGDIIIGFKSLVSYLKCSTGIMLALCVGSIAISLCIMQQNRELKDCFESNYALMENIQQRLVAIQTLAQGKEDVVHTQLENIQQRLVAIQTASAIENTAQNIECIGEKALPEGDINPEGNELEEQENNQDTEE